MSFSNYIIRYEAQGGTCAVTEETVIADTGLAHVLLPTATKEGYEFLGWSTNPNSESGRIGWYEVTMNMTFHAIWSLSSTNYRLHLGAERVHLYLGDTPCNLVIPEGTGNTETSVKFNVLTESQYLAAVVEETINLTEFYMIVKE